MKYGSFAITPTGKPSMRAKPVMSDGPKYGAISKNESRSRISSSIRRAS